MQATAGCSTGTAGAYSRQTASCNAGTAGAYGHRAGLKLPRGSCREEAAARKLQRESCREEAAARKLPRGALGMNAVTTEGYAGKRPAGHFKHFRGLKAGKRQA